MNSDHRSEAEGAGIGPYRSEEPATRNSTEALLGSAGAHLEALANLDRTALAELLAERIAALFPLPRSLTGPGVRQTLDIMQTWIGHGVDDVTMNRHEVPSGTKVLDWVVPEEWTLRRGVVRALDGRVVIDSAVHLLHVVGYSEPVRRRVTRKELLAHVHTVADRPAVIPYRTAYYRPTWGFCLQHDRLDELTDLEYDVEIDADLGPGRLSYGEVILPGSTREEVLITTHSCHPAMANDNCAGLALAATLFEHLSRLPRRLTYRLVIAPATIGAITWLAQHRDTVERIVHGVVLNNVGDASPLTWKRSRTGSTRTDVIAELLLRRSDPDLRVIDFHPYGYDERQYCSPGFDLAVGALSRSTHGAYPEYHSSADNLSFVKPTAVADSVTAMLSLFAGFEADVGLRNTAPYGEAQLGRRGLYAAIGGATDTKEWEMALLWILNQADGTATAVDIAGRSGLDLGLVVRAAQALADVDLVRSG